MTYIQVTNENLADSHICCGFSDKKIKKSYQEKKDWLSKAFEASYVFKRLDERAKVFIEYGPIEKAWFPIEGKDYLVLGCFGFLVNIKNGHGKALLDEAIREAKSNKMKGLCAVVGKKNSIL